MKNRIDEIWNIRDRLLTKSLFAIVAIGFPALVASLSRAFYTGWQDIMYLHIAMYLLVLVRRTRTEINMQCYAMIFTIAM